MPLIPSVSALEKSVIGGQKAGASVATIIFTGMQSHQYLIYGKNRFMATAEQVRSL